MIMKLGKHTNAQRNTELRTLDESQLQDAQGGLAPIVYLVAGYVFAHGVKVGYEK